MSEVKLYGGLLVLLLIGSYWSWTREDEADASQRVTLFSAQEGQIERIDFATKTQTVAFSYRERDGQRYPWFELTNKTRTRSFAGNEDTKKLLERFTPLEAMRSLGKDLTTEELKSTKLDAPERKLVLKTKNRSKTFRVGGRTNGARDHYVQPEGETEVLLVESRTLSDLQFPDGKYMQRKLRTAALKEVGRVVLTAGDKSKTGLQKNRLSPTDAFWVEEGAGDEPNETLKNFISKLEKLTATDYVSGDDAPKSAESVLSVEWFDENGDPLGTATISRAGSGKSANYYAQSTATRVRVKVSRFTAEGLEKDLPTLFP